ncbi:MAG: hypothetical protein IPM00_04230 [Tetrasphaera sp.]|nr:hypothetical protein [Tetrasphaera sp.]
MRSRVRLLEGDDVVVEDDEPGPLPEADEDNSVATGQADDQVRDLERRPRVDPAFSDLPATDDASRQGAAARLEVVSGRGEDRESCGEGRFDGAHGLGGLVLRAVIARNGDDLHRTDLDRSTSDPPTGRLRVGDDPVEGSPMGRGRPTRLRRSWPVTHHAVSSHPGTLWLITGHNRRIHRQPAAAGAKRELARVSRYAASPPRRSHRVELRSNRLPSSSSPQVKAPG